ncbi:MHYT domain-containing protein [Streptomyces aureus]|uniref:MHYT domain-containing protein n=1 Tax=Streptomyces aureus TaxID=193461 RepID=UPI0007C440F6|nr:MHYT domain-containing protein [Streptomyces aureus]
MNGTIDGFSYGLVTPVAAYVMACVGSALGLRCVVRTVHHEPGWRLGWLALGASALGCGIWTMHFIAMTGFSVAETPITYDIPLTVLSLAVAIVVVSAGVFIVGHRGATRAALTVGGSITGLGVAMMHYLGMFAMQLNGELHYNVLTVTLSVIIALVAATAALWAAVSVRGFLPTLGASLVMGLAVTGMHYTGMAAVSVHLHNTIHSTVESAAGGQEGTSLLLPMLLGPIIFLIIAAAIVMFDPVLILGDGNGSKKSTGRSKVVARGNTMPVHVAGNQDSSALSHTTPQGGQWASTAPQWPAAEERAPQYGEPGAGASYGARYEGE